MINKFKTKKISIKLSSQSFSFIIPSDPDEILDSVTEKEFSKDEQLPYWADLWPSSEAIFDYCLNHKVIDGAKICEIGAGLGIVSAAIAYNASASLLVSTDISTDSVYYIKENFKRNNLTGESACCDWRYSPFKEKFDVIIGADILYEERWTDPVLNFIKENLKNDGYALISDPQRKHWNNFKKKASKRDFKVTSEGIFLQKSQDVKVELIRIEL